MAKVKTQPKDKRPRDPNKLAKLMLDIATGEVEDTITPIKRTEAAKASKKRKNSKKPAKKAASTKRKK